MASDMHVAPGSIILLLLVIVHIAQTFVLKWLSKRISETSLSFIACFICTTINAYASSAFHRFLKKLMQCQNDNMSSFCYFFFNDSIFNMSIFVWETPLFALLLQITVGIFKKRLISLRSLLLIVILCIAFSKTYAVATTLLFDLLS